MLHVEKSNSSDLYRKAEEALYQIQEMQYHLKWVKESLKDAIYHLNKVEYHKSELLQELNIN